MTNRATLHKALPILCAGYARKWGVKIVIGGQTASTNGERIVLPNIPDSWGNFDALWGYLAHEAAHVRLTDWNMSFGRGLLKTMFNITEDCRIEREMISIYPGMAYTLNEVARYMSHAGHYAIPTVDSHPVQVLEAYCLYYLQCRLVGQHAIEHELIETEKVFKAVFPPEVFDKLHVLFHQVPAMTCSQDAKDLAIAILSMLEEEARREGEPQPTPQDQSQNGDDDQDGDDQGAGQGQSQNGDDDQEGDDQGTGQGQSQNGDDDQEGDDQGAGQGQSQKGDDDQEGDDQGTGQGQSQNGDDDQDGDDQGTGQGQGQNGDDDQDGDDQGAGQGQSQNGDDDQDGTVPVNRPGHKPVSRALDAGDDDHIKDAFEQLKRELEGDAAPGAPLCTTIHQPGDTRPMDSLKAQELKERTRLVSSGIRSQLMGLVQSVSRKSTRNVRSGNRVNGKRLTRLKQGDTRVFSRRAEKKHPNTAVHLLVDMSYSMGIANSTEHRLPYTVANEAALALAIGLEGIKGVNPAVTYFRGVTQPLQSAITHGQSVAQNVERFSCFPDGTTPMAEAIWYAGFELLQQKEERKLIVIVTDGEPDSEAAVHDVVNRCHGSDIELIGIGIGSDAIKRYVRNSTVIQDVEDLQSTLFTLIGESLTLAS